MAHSYSNFTDAFADLCHENTHYRSFMADCYSKCNDADDYANAGNYKWGIRFAVYAIKALATSVDAIIDGYYWEPEQSAFFESIYWASQEGGDGELDMSMILDAMWKAKAHQCLLFIPMIDAMRGSIQNKTVTSQYMADALRHFME